MQHYESIRHLLHRVRNRWRALCLFQALVRAALGASAAIGLALIASHWTGRAPLALAFVAAAGLVLVVAAVAWACLPLRHVPDEAQVARFIEERVPALDDRLASAVDVVQPERYAASPAIVEPMLADAARQVNAVDIDTIVSRQSLRRAGLQAAAASGVLLALFFAARGPAAQAVDAASMTLFPSRVTLEVTPGSARIRLGAPFAIQARLVGNRAPIAARVEVAVPDGWRATEMAASAGAFRLAVSSVMSSFKYRVIAGSVRSPEFEVTVARPPRVTRIDVEYTYPTALGLKPRTEEDGGDIYAPAGTDVRIRIHADRAIATAQIALSDGKSIPLSTEAPTTFSTSMKVVADNSYRVALADGDGFANPGETEYFIRMLEDRPPEVRLVAPAADKSVTPLEEVEIEAQAEDDYGIASMDLVYAVRGGKDTVVPLGPGKHTTTAVGRHTLYLEDLHVQPGDFVSYYVRARDVVRGSRSSETKSDIYFLEVKPFEQEFQLAQSQAQSGAGGGSSIDELVNAQKDIIVATWKLDRRAQAAKGARSEQDIQAVSRAESELKARVVQTASTFREGTMRDPRRRAAGGSDAPKAGETLPEEDAMTAASTAMGRAVVSLDALKTAAALPPEMEALNHLLKAQAEVKRREVSRQQTASGNGNNNRNLDMSSLFDRELQRQQQTNYETTSTTEPKQDPRSTLDKIKELARRQDELLKHQKDLAKQRDTMTEDDLKRELEKLTREQSELRQQAEELSRQMNSPQSNNSAGGQSGTSRQSGKQQSQSGQSSGSAGSRQMRDVSEQMRSAASDLRRQDSEKASASSSQALDKLRDLEKQMQGGLPDGRRRALGETQLEARQLAEAQREVASELGKTTPGEAGKDATRRLAGEQQRLAERAQSLQENLKRQATASANSSSPTDKNAKAAAGDAARDLEQQQLAERMQQAATELRATAGGATTKDARSQAVTQEDIARSLDKVADGLSAAAGSRDGESQKLSSQLARARDLRNRMARLSQAIDRLGKQNASAASQPSTQKSPGSEGKTGEGQQAGNGGSGSDLSRLQEEYARELEQTRELVNELKREDPNFAKSGAGITPEGQGSTMSAPGTEAFKQDFAGWQVLRQQVTTALDQAEATLSKRLQSKASKDQLPAGVDDKAPPEYEKQVDSYFKALAGSAEKK